MISSMLEAFVPGKTWVEKFTRYEYRNAFKEYVQLYEPVYTAAVGQGQSVGALAQQLLDALEQYRKALPFWSRAAVMADGKMALVTYLTPMLLGAAEPKCKELAEVLCERWNTRWPKDTYTPADFSQLIGGFRHSILGIDLAGKHLDKDRDER